MSKSALIVWGGWAGHDPQNVAALLELQLKENGFSVECANTVDAFNDRERLKTLDLIVPHWTMGKITTDQAKNVSRAVEGGVGLGGIHGGMCDAFRENTDWQFMTGGQFVAHPGNDGLKYTVRITAPHWITEGIGDFEVLSEQYYMHIDPAIKVLATTRFPVADGAHTANGEVEMPVTWTRMHGKGRVFYCSIGHNEKAVLNPPVLKMCTRGLLWAAHAD